MALHFSAPHCRDVIEIRTVANAPAVGCIRIEQDGHRLFTVGTDGLEFVADLFAAVS